MIAFRKGWNPNNDEVEDLVSQLKEILSEMSVNPIEEKADSYNHSFHYSVNISDIIELIHQGFYEEDSKTISLIITKNPNNSLDVSIDKLS